MTYFKFFELEPSFYLDEALLKKRYLLNSKKYHPDFFSLESEAKQQEVLEMSTLNNKAFQILSNFDSRMAYILQEKGLLVGENHEVPQSFLMEIMEFNEAVMELEFDFDQKVFDDTLNKIHDFEKELIDSIKPYLTGFKDSESEDDALKKVKEFYLKKKYLLRIHENLNKFAAASPKGDF